MSAGNEREFIDFQQNKKKGGLAMKCPLLSLQWVGLKSGDDIFQRDCLKEECAWWDKDNEQCAMMSLARGLWIFNQQMVALLQKMPTVEQFKK